LFGGLLSTVVPIEILRRLVMLETIKCVIMALCRLSDANNTKHIAKKETIDKTSGHKKARTGRAKIQ
jgi:hypothetical protein